MKLLWVFFPLGIGLAACAARPTHLQPPPGQYARFVPPTAALVMSDGVKIPVRIWSAESKNATQQSASPRGVILALHGFNDSRDAWELRASNFTAAGFELIAPDQRGFGGTADRGGWAGTERMLSDVEEEIAFAHRQHPGVALYLMGESMGGALLTVLSAERPLPDVAGIVLLSPAVWKLDWASRKTLDVMTAISPDWEFTGEHLPVHVVATDNLAALLRLYYDPLTLRATRLVALRGLVNLMQRAADDSAQVHGNVLVVYGGHDDLVPPDAMRQMWRKLPVKVRRDFIPAGHHLLLRDRAGGKVASDVVSWLCAPENPLPSGGDVAAAISSYLLDGAGHEPMAFLPSRLDDLVGTKGR